MTMNFHESVLLNAQRLQLLVELALTSNTYETVYDKLTVFASKVMEVPVSLVSMVAADHQYYKSHVGLPEPWKSRRNAPMPYSYCKHVVVQNKPLIINDARENDLTKDSPAIAELDAIGYLGMPLTLSSGMSLGSFCVMDTAPHPWTEVEIAIMEELAAMLILEFETRARVKMFQASADQLKKIQQALSNLIDQIDTNASQDTILEQIRHYRQAYHLV